MITELIHKILVSRKPAQRPLVAAVEHCNKLMLKQERKLLCTLSQISVLLFKAVFLANSQLLVGNFYSPDRAFAKLFKKCSLFLY